MSSSAGRVLQIFKGDYSGSVQYDPLDCVLYQGSTYVCKATTQGNAPTNTTYWQIQAQGVSNAAGLSYNNTASHLTATNVQDAIDELNSDLAGKADYSDVHRGEVYVTADGVKTNATLLNELFALIDFSKVRAQTTLTWGLTRFWIQRAEVSQYSFCTVAVGVNGEEVSQVTLESGASKVAYGFSGSSHDGSSTVPSSGVIISVHY